jgi:glutathione synthase/RimK-type ligase-like ATP-grasp enzyme
VILLLGQRNDPPLRAVAVELERMRAEYLCADRELEVAKRWHPGSDAVLKISGQVLPLEEVKSAYLRPLGLPAKGEGDRQALGVLLAWADQSAARILNRPSASLPNNSKPLQAQWVARFGFHVPETLITTDPHAAREFACRHGEIVYKSISGVRSIVRRLSRDRFAELDHVRHCPTQFQRWIPGDDLRVHVIGETVAAVRIVSDRDDYRYAARDGGSIEAASTELDPSVAESLRSMVLQMGLLVAGIDLRRTPTGELYCLEINPSPAFTYYEQLAGVALARRIAELLL